MVSLIILACSDLEPPVFLPTTLAGTYLTQNSTYYHIHVTRELNKTNTRAANTLNLIYENIFMVSSNSLTDEYCILIGGEQWTLFLCLDLEVCRIYTCSICKHF